MSSTSGSQEAWRREINGVCRPRLDAGVLTLKLADPSCDGELGERAFLLAPWRLAWHWLAGRKHKADRQALFTMTLISQMLAVPA